MIIKNANDPEVIRSSHTLPRGVSVRLLMAENLLRGLEYVAYVVLLPGQQMDEHIDQVEEVHFVCRGRGIMQVEEEEREVKERDAIWVPAGSAHSLRNPTGERLEVLIVGAYPRRR